jgi:hypothetical protein
MNGILRTQLNDKVNIENKVNDLINISRNNIDNKMKLITNLLLTLKEENEQIISKSK